MSHYPRLSHSYVIPYLLLILLLNTVNAEEAHQFKISFSPEFIAQGDFEVNHDALIGGDLKFYLTDEEPWRHFVKTGYYRSLEREGSALDIFDIGIGSQYRFAKWFGKNVYTELSFSAMYSQEEFAITLIDREASSSFQEWDLQTSLGLGMEFSKSYSGELYIKRLGAKGNTLGLSFSTSF